MKTRILLTLSVATVLAAASQAQTTGPKFFTLGGFKFNDNGSAFTAATGANAILPDFTFGGTTYSGVKFTMTPIDITTISGGTGAVVGGNISLLQAVTNTPLLTIDFDFASFSTAPNLFGATNVNPDPLDMTFLPDNVTYGGSLVTPGNPDGNVFQFSLSPASGFTGGTLNAYGNVTPVPEPASMAALGAGALALLRRRRRA